MKRLGSLMQPATALGSRTPLRQAHTLKNNASRFYVDDVQKVANISGSIVPRKSVRLSSLDPRLQYVFGFKWGAPPNVVRDEAQRSLVPVSNKLSAFASASRRRPASAAAITSEPPKAAKPVTSVYNDVRAFFTNILGSEQQTPANISTSVKGMSRPQLNQLVRLLDAASDRLGTRKAIARRKRLDDASLRKLVLVRLIPFLLEKSLKAATESARIQLLSPSTQVASSELVHAIQEAVLKNAPKKAVALPPATETTIVAAIPVKQPVRTTSTSTAKQPTSRKKY